MMLRRFEGHGNPVLDSDEVYAKAFSKLGNCKIMQLPKGIIERPYDNGFRPKYLLKKQIKVDKTQNKWYTKA